MSPTQPIPISPSNRDRDRRQSLSSISTGSPSSSPELITPSSSSFKSFSPSSSPIMSYIHQQKTPGTAHSANSNTNSFPFRRPWQSPVVEEEEDEAPVVSPKHVRRASTQLAGRFDSPNPTSGATASTERATGVLRRLSFGAPAFIKNARPPSPPPNSAVSTYPQSSAPHVHHGRAKTRSATISVDRPRRAPSPMSERILKGQFDGFN